MTGDDLRRFREAAGLSQRALADRAGIHHRSVNYWERKRVLDMRGYAVERMAKALGWRISRRPKRARHGVPDIAKGFPPWARGPDPAKRRVICGAKTRKGHPCRAKSEPGKRRCRFHGGMSTGPRTPEGKARVAEAQRQRWARWRAERDGLGDPA